MNRFLMFILSTVFLSSLIYACPDLTGTYESKTPNGSLMTFKFEPKSCAELKVILSFYYQNGTLMSEGSVNVFTDGLFRISSETPELETRAKYEYTEVGLKSVLETANKFNGKKSIHTYDRIINSDGNHEVYAKKIDFDGEIQTSHHIERRIK